MEAENIMKRTVCQALILNLALCPLIFTQNTATADDDPYLWLEEISGDKALDWARGKNKISLDELQSDKRYKQFFKKAQDLLNDKERIPYGGLTNNYVYNFWQDEKHVKGIWRKTGLEEYTGKAPKWDILLDLDELSAKENESWVWKGANCLSPEEKYCLVMLSKGGKDASVIREFDAESKKFAEGGFYIEESKSHAVWFDENTLLVGYAVGKESQTESGYARIIKKWKRGTDIAGAETIYSAEKTDMAVSPICSVRPEGKYTAIERRINFFEAEYRLVTDEGKLIKIPIPADAQLRDFFKGRILATIRKDWNTGRTIYPQGSLIAFNLTGIQSRDIEENVKLLFEPDDKTTIDGVATVKDFAAVSLLENIKGRILRLEYNETADLWQKRSIAVPDNGAVDLISGDSFGDKFMFLYQDFLTPPSLYLADSKDAPRVIKTLPKKFDSKGYSTAQKWAVSKDGTKIPYFIIYPSGMGHDAKNPTLLYGYGGFEMSNSPFYSAMVGNLWLKQGGVFVVANIRGGGEFGPKWHQAALKQNRQKAFDDFIAVAENLISEKITSPAYLAIRGGSNGGLLVGAAFTQRPDLFKAVLCEVPLFDMLRYTKLLAGPSWRAEYGDPDSPEMRPAIAAYSPYQNIKKGTNYPTVFFLTSSKDDRVHPGHARKAAAKLMDMGQKIYYYENIEGGHGAGADNSEKAKFIALEYIFALRQLFPPLKSPD